MEGLEAIAAKKGCEILKAGVSLTGKFQGFVPWEDCVITTMSVDNVPVDLTAKNLDGIIPAGIGMYFIGAGSAITEITLTSGVLNLIKK